jgi:hypothetical protein
MSAAKMLSVSRRITSVLDNFYARVHQKSGNGLEADVHLVRTCTRLYRHTNMVNMADVF